jgi:hypothetical protein
VIFKLPHSATIYWRKLSTRALNLSLFEGKVFTDGVLELTHAA